ncbi:hypothetical protein HYPSUDRAFT_43010 [Hypholoma sublateritium FD-334 SS-4]|uniref:Uncharacterized protein n=1 Tax=Hypholoma sublateritium (strain FD-334 SS-4) TaxID=945553 RepID=A0A0D2PKM8_HYPSF|nr:hypothetical protein HYPSUDRAFT_43010 [Hypholoma sublateritium FD-334 SS-4]
MRADCQNQHPPMLTFSTNARSGGPNYSYPKLEKLDLSLINFVLPSSFNEHEEQLLITEPFGQAPINKLPIELLTKIFEMCIYRFSISAGLSPYTWESHRYMVLRWDKATAPFNLLQVCSSWRTIVQSTPTLWNTFTGRSWRRYRPEVQEIDHWLKNTGTSPLRLHLNSDDDPERRDKCYQHSILDLYATRAHQWESLCLNLSRSMTAKFSSILQTHKDVHGFPNLTRLELNFDMIPCPEQHVIEELATAISHIKSVRQIIWHQGPFNGHLNLPWNQLDVVYFSVPQSGKKVLSYMSQCVVATKITFRRFWTLDIVLDPQALPVSLPNVRSLHLGAKRGQISFEPLNHFTMPNLESLEIDTLTREPSIYSFLTQFLDRSKCTLKDIMIIEFCYEADITDIITRFFNISLHSIPTVQMFNRYIHDAMLELLKTRPEMRTFPKILAWNVGISPGVVGWKDLSTREILKFSWNDGKLNFSALPTVDGRR